MFSSRSQWSLIETSMRYLAIIKFCWWFSWCSHGDVFSQILKTFKDSSFFLREALWYVWHARTQRNRNVLVGRTCGAVCAHDQINYEARYMCGTSRTRITIVATHKALNMSYTRHGSCAFQKIFCVFGFEEGANELDLCCEIGVPFILSRVRNWFKTAYCQQPTHVKSACAQKPNSEGSCGSNTFAVHKVNHLETPNFFEFPRNSGNKYSQINTIGYYVSFQCHFQKS